VNLLAGILLIVSLISPAGVTVKVQDASGAPLKDELVIIQALSGRQHEVARALTNDEGDVPQLQLNPGLYRAIATAPYGLWETEIREFVVTDQSANIVLLVRPLPTSGFGDVVPVRASRAEVHVRDSNGVPVAGANVLVRDKNATLSSEASFATNQAGVANVLLPGNPTIIVVYVGSKLATKTVDGKPSSITIQLPK
jgi:hypothetical protein